MVLDDQEEGQNSVPRARVKRKTDAQEVDKVKTDTHEQEHHHVDTDTHEQDYPERRQVSDDTLTQRKWRKVEDARSKTSMRPKLEPPKSGSKSVKMMLLQMATNNSRKGRPNGDNTDTRPTPDSDNPSQFVNNFTDNIFVSFCLQGNSNDLIMKNEMESQPAISQPGVEVKESQEKSI